MVEGVKEDEDEEEEVEEKEEDAIFECIWHQIEWCLNNTLWARLTMVGVICEHDSNK